MTRKEFAHDCLVRTIGAQLRYVSAHNHFGANYPSDQLEPRKLHHITVLSLFGISHTVLRLSVRVKRFVSFFPHRARPFERKLSPLGGFHGDFIAVNP